MSGTSELFKAQITGEIPSWYDEEDDLDGYTTNYGGATVIKSTGKINYACIGLGRNQSDSQMIVKISKDEFQVVKNKQGSNIDIAEINSSGYPYKHKELSPLDLIEVLEMLQSDDNYHYVVVLVKKTLIKLIIKHIKLNKEEKQALEELFRIWRKPITIQREPITGGK